MTCRCHSSDLYASLVDCPSCGHRSLDRSESWEGCERRACGYEKVLNQDRLDLVLAVDALSWAVGHIEGLGHGTDNYAARTLAKLRSRA